MPNLLCRLIGRGICTTLKGFSLPFLLRKHYTLFINLLNYTKFTVYVLAGVFARSVYVNQI